MPKKSRSEEEEPRGDPVTLAPLPFDEAVADLLKVKPERETIREEEEAERREAEAKRRRARPPS